MATHTHFTFSVAKAFLGVDAESRNGMTRLAFCGTCSPKFKTAANAIRQPGTWRTSVAILSENYSRLPYKSGRSSFMSLNQDSAGALEPYARDVLQT